MGSGGAVLIIIVALLLLVLAVRGDLTCLVSSYNNCVGSSAGAGSTGTVGPSQPTESQPGTALTPLSVLG